MLSYVHRRIESIVAMAYGLKTLYHQGKIAYSSRTSPVQKRLGIGYDIPQAKLVLIYGYNDLFDRRVPYSATRIIDDSLECLFVIRVIGQTEISNQILDFLALVERSTSIYLVGHPQLTKCLFHRTGLCIRTVQNSKILVL